MKIFISPGKSASNNLMHLSINGFSIDVSNVLETERLAISIDSGKISVDIITAESNIIEIPLLAENVSELNQESDDLKSFKNSNSEHLAENAAVTEEGNMAKNPLFEKLVLLRRQLSKEFGVRPYIIFHDTTLKDMVLKKPVELEEMRRVSGVGQVKLEKYGSQFVGAIKKYIEESA